MKDIEGTAYTLIAYSKALRCKVRLVIWQMPNGKKKLFFSTDTSLIAYSKALRCKVRLVIWQMPNGKKKLFFSTDTSLSGEEVLLYYRTRFQIEFCFRDAKGYTGHLADAEWQEETILLYRHLTFG